jgi:acetyltransferase
LAQPAALRSGTPADERFAPQWQRIGRARDGRSYRIRPIRVEDAQADRSFLMHLSADSRYKRMMGTCREPSPALIDRLVHVDRRSSMAFVAVVGPVDAEVIIGVARYAAIAGASEAEFAIAVADEWQSHGIGSTLLEVLFEYARCQGLHCLRGLVLANNERMLELARKHLLALRRVAGDGTTIEVTKDL